MLSNILIILLFLHLSVTVRYNAVKQRTGYFWQLDSTNINLNFSVNGDITNNCEARPGTSTLKLDPLSPYQDYACDNPLSLLRSATKFMKRVRGEDIDFILWTGDSGPNDKKIRSIEESKENIRLLTESLREEFPYSTVYPVLGDTDFMVDNQYYKQIYRFVGDLWNTWLPPAAITTLAQGGYYKVELAGRRLQLIGLNTNLWLKTMEISEMDPGFQFHWLEQSLEKARDKHQTIIIFGHSPPGVLEIEDRRQHWYHPMFNSRYNRIVQKYSDVIVGQYFGHQNTDSFRIFRDARRNPIGFALISPGLSPRTILSNGMDPVLSNPSTRLYKYSTYDGKVLDYSQFSLALEESNSKYNPQWKLAYNFSSQYRNLLGLTTESLDQLLSTFQTNTKSGDFEAYLLTNSQHPPLTCTQRCRHGHLCAISNVGYNRYRQCMLVTSNSRQKTADPLGVLLLVGILSLVTKTTL